VNDMDPKSGKPKRLRRAKPLQPASPSPREPDGPTPSISEFTISSDPGTRRRVSKHRPQPKWLVLAIVAGVGGSVALLLALVFVLGRGDQPKQTVGKPAQRRTAVPAPSTPLPPETPPPPTESSPVSVGGGGVGGPASTSTPGKLVPERSDNSSIGEQETPTSSPEASSPPDTDPSVARTLEPSPTAARSEMRLSDLIARIEPSVVRINVRGRNGDGVGSGMVVDRQGRIVTNFHVVRDALSAEVFFEDGSKYEVAGYLAADPSRDLAVLQLREQGKQVVPVPLAQNSPLKGDRVVAFGAPLGFSFTASEGIVSAIRTGREIRESFLSNVGVDVYSMHGYALDVSWLQTTTPISGGNSGGPLVNLRGEMVGVNTWSRSDGQNLNFAVAASEVARVLKNCGTQPRNFSSLPSGNRSINNGPDADDKETGRDNTVVRSTPDASARLVPGSSPGEVYRFSRSQAAVVSLAVSPDGRYLATAAADGKAHVIDIQQLRAKHLLQASVSAISSVTFSANPQQLITARERMSIRDYNISIWDPDAGTRLASYRSYSSHPTFVDVTPNGNAIATTFADGSAEVVIFPSDFDALSRYLVNTRYSSTSYYCAGFSSDGRFVAFGNGDGWLSVWTGAGEKIARVGQMRVHSAAVRGVAFSSDDRQILSGGSDHLLRVWSNWSNSGSWRSVAQLSGAKSPITCVAYSPDRSLVAGGSADGTLRIWELGLRNKSQLIEGHEAPITAAAFLPSAKYLVSASQDGSVRVWEVDKAKRSRGKDEFAASPLSPDTPQVTVVAGETPVPDTETLAAAQQLVKDLYQEQYEQARRRDEKLRLVRKILEQSRRQRNTPAETYALLSAAREIAAACGDIALTQEAVRSLLARFAVDPLQEQATALRKLATNVDGASNRRQVAHATLKLAGHVMAGDDFVEARRLADVALSIAESLGDQQLKELATRQMSALDAATHARQRYQQAIDTLQSRPRDGDAQRDVGHYLCFVRADWPAGLQHLAKSSDEQLKELAVRDLAKPHDASAQFQLAEAWRQAAESGSVLKRDGCLASAVYWYEVAMPGLSELQRLKAKRELDAIGDAAIARE